MLSNHVVSAVPADGAIDVPLTSSITVQFDATVQVLHTEGSLVVTQGDTPIAGVTQHDAAAKTLSFVPSKVALENRIDCWCFYGHHSRFLQAQSSKLPSPTHPSHTRFPSFMMNV